MLARAVKQVNHPLYLLNVTDLVNMRMYQTNDEVWRGFKKNIFPGMGRSHFIFLAIFILYCMLYIFPFITVFSSLIFAEDGWSATTSLAIVAYFIGVAIQTIITAVHRTPMWLSFFLPFSIMAMLLIMVDSWRTAVSGKSYEWKGRRYQ
jgi:hypothetical protein